jgi:hypothetical protein
MHRDETYKRPKSRDSSINEKGERTSRQSVTTSHEICINNQIFYHSHQRHGLALSRFVEIMLKMTYYLMSLFVRQFYITLTFVTALMENQPR